APSVNALFDDYIANPGNHGTMMFWRLLNVELWMREFIDGEETAAPQSAGPGEPAQIDQGDETDQGDKTDQGDETDQVTEVEQAPKSDYLPNPGKQLDLRSGADDRTWRRFPLQT